MEKYVWTKTPNGYQTTERRWGANIELITDKNLSDADLDRFLTNFYSMLKVPLNKGGNYGLFPKGLDW
jgi:hypothetical protein